MAITREQIQAIHRHIYGGVAHTAFARDVGVTVGAARAWYDGSKSPSPENQAKIRAMLRVKLERVGALVQETEKTND